MRSLDRLEQQKRQKQIKKSQRPPDEEEMEEEMERPRFMPLNKNRHAFGDPDGGPFNGINNAPSVFKKSAVFPDPWDD